MHQARINENEELLLLRDRAHMLSPVYWNAVLQTSQRVADIYGKTLDIEYNFFMDGKMNIVVRKKNWDEVGEYIANRLIEEVGYFETIESKTLEAENEINLFLSNIKNSDSSKVSFSELVNLAEEIKNLFLKYDAASVFAWFVAGDILKSKIGEKLKIFGDDLDVIAMPEEKTLVTRMELEAFVAGMKKEGKNEVAKELSEKYFWIPFSYDGPTIWDEKIFGDMIGKYRSNYHETVAKYDEITKQADRLKQKATEILDRFDLGEKEKRLIHILRSTAIWTDERKRLEYQLFFWYYWVLLELEKRCALPVRNLKYLFTNELIELEKNAQKLGEISKERMNHSFMTISKNGEIWIASEQEMLLVKEKIEKQAHQNELVGKVASRGTKEIYMAKVKILSSAKDCWKVEPGEILVTTMTTPDFMPAMKNALGFITDEGGVTCHAAIVARELNKPCIIATRNATKVLKDGDLVEMGMITGIVKKIGI